MYRKYGLPKFNLIGYWLKIGLKFANEQLLFCELHSNFEYCAKYEIFHLQFVELLSDSKVCLSNNISLHH